VCEWTESKELEGAWDGGGGGGAWGGGLRRVGGVEGGLGALGGRGAVRLGVVVGSGWEGGREVDVPSAASRRRTYVARIWAKVRVGGREDGSCRKAATGGAEKGIQVWHNEAGQSCA
jgi:hypothetical protein